MSYTFRVIFEGICGFVPDTPFFVQKDGKWEPGKPSEVSVLLPKCQVARAAPWKDAGVRVVREAHWPVLTVEASRLQATNAPRNPDLKWHGRIKVSINGEEVEKEADWATFLLDEEKVRFVLSDCQSNLRVDTKIPTDPTTPDERPGGDSGSLWWLPRLAEISPQDRKASSVLKPAPAQKVHDSLAAAVEVTAGRLSVVDFNRDKYGNPRTWSFTHPTKWWSTKRYWKRPIGNTLALVLEQSATELKVELERGQVLSFGLRGDSTEPVQIFVSNMEVDDRLLQGRFRGSRDRDPDFQELYRLSSSGSEVGPVPNAKAEPAGPRVDPCSPGGFDGWKS